MTAQQRGRIPFVGMAITLVAAIVYVGITAFQGGGVVNVPLPSAETSVGAIALALLGEFARRMLKKLDGIGDKVDAVDAKVERYSGEFREFRSTVGVVLTDFDGRGGVVQDVRDLQAAVYGDRGPAPRGVPSPLSLQFPPSHSKAMP